MRVEHLAEILQKKLKTGEMSVQARLSFGNGSPPFPEHPLRILNYRLILKIRVSSYYGFLNKRRASKKEGEM